jgi:GNAT superfamily N-acetyltransferase
MEIRELENETDLEAAFPVLKELRPALTLAGLRDSFPRQRAEGYRLWAAEVGGRIAAVIGWRILHLLHSGKTLYVDDLVTSPAYRGQGLARALLDHTEAEARRAGCSTFSLDSGPQRHDAHRLYLNFRLRIVSHHFAKDL